MRNAVKIALYWALFCCTAASAWSELLDFEGAATLDDALKADAGWSYVQKGGGSAELGAWGEGKCFAAVVKDGQASAYLSRQLHPAESELYVAFTCRVSEVKGANSEILALLVQGKKDVTLALGDRRNLGLTTNIASDLISHYSGQYWWPDKSCHIVLGIKKGEDGYVRLWADGAPVYDTGRLDTGEGGITGILVGATNGFPGFQFSGRILIDDLAVGRSYGEVAKHVPRTITVQPVVERAVNPDCFGVNLGWYGAGWTRDYPKVKRLAGSLGMTAARVNLQTHVNWNHHWPFFSYFPHPADPPGASIPEHITEMFATRDPLAICVINLMGEKGSDWRPEKSAELVRFNKAYLKPDLKKGLRAMYELGNEPCNFIPVTEGWYFNAGDGRYAQVGNGKTTYRDAVEADKPEYLDNTSDAYSYRFRFAPGDYLYIGMRWKFDAVGYCLKNVGRVKGDKALQWEYWDGARWIPFGGLSEIPFSDEWPRRASDFLGPRSWNSIRWDDTRLEGWARASAAQISQGDAKSREALYWIRIGHKSGAYDGEAPLEEFVRAALSPQGYLEALRLFYPAISSAGGVLCAAAGNEGLRYDFIDMLAANQSLFDGVAWMSYPDPPMAEGMQSGRMCAPLTSTLWSVDRLSDRAREFRAKFPGKKLVITEWNGVGSECAVAKTLAGGLRVAIGLCEIVRSGWDAAIHHRLFASFPDSSCMITNSGENPRLRPSGIAFRTVSRYSKKYVLRTFSTYKGLYACAFQGESPEDGALIVVNRTGSAEQARVSLPVDWKRVIVYEMAGAPLDDNERGDKMGLRPKDVLDVAAGLEYRFPAYSLTVLDTTARLSGVD
jgi:hypothetical protein